MRTSRIRQIAAIGALALIVIAPVAGCGADALTPLPVDDSSAQPAVSASQAPAVQPSISAATDSSPPRIAEPAAPKPVRTTTKASPPGPQPSHSSSTCYGAVRHDLDLQNTVLELQKSMCFHTGGVLRLQGIGPGLVTATPESLVSGSYEAGVVDLRFIRAGTVTVTIPQNDQNHIITVVVRP
jgi:hypothetical protein